MKTKLKKKRKTKRNLLLGTWYNDNEYGSEVEFTITRAGKSYIVRAKSGYDGEKADIFETSCKGSVLSFAAHWNSTGRFARYRFSLSSTNRLDVTYTYTDTEMYHRKVV